MKTAVILGHRVNFDRYHQYFFITPSLSYCSLYTKRVELSWGRFCVEVFL